MGASAEGWVDRVAADIAWLDEDLRAALRALARGVPHPRIAGWDRVLLRAHEARTVLRATIPAPIAGSPVRDAHARLLAALGLMAGHLQGLHVVHGARHDRPAESAIAAAAALRVEVDEWRRQMEWRRATRAARVRGWRCPPRELPINAVIQPEGLRPSEHTGIAAAGMAAHPAAGLRALRARAGRDSQFELRRAAPVVEDPRQLRLVLPIAA